MDTKTLYSLKNEDGNYFAGTVIGSPCYCGNPSSAEWMEKVEAERLQKKYGGTLHSGEFIDDDDD